MDHSVGLEPGVLDAEQKSWRRTIIQFERKVGKARMFSALFCCLAKRPLFLGEPKLTLSSGRPRTMVVSVLQAEPQLQKQVPS